MEGQSTTCPTCERVMDLVRPNGRKTKPVYRCFNCDNPDPINSNKVKGYLRSLQPPRKPSDPDADVER